MRRYPQAGFVLRHLQRQRAYGMYGARASRSAARVRPPSPDQVGVPPQHSARGDNQAKLAEVTAGQQRGQRGQDRPVGPGQPRCPDLTLENGDLVTQDEDLSILGEVGPGEQGKPAEHPEHREVDQS